MPCDLYCFLASPYCRSVMLTARALGVQLDLKPIDQLEGGLQNPGFLQMNPQHVVPTLVDGGLVLWESRAILIYLADKYGKTDALYPKDPAKRARVNQLLFFDVGTLFPRALDVILPAMSGELPWDFGLVMWLEKTIGYLDCFLETSKWAAGDQLTIADYALASSVAYIEALAGVDLSNYRNLRRWYAACKKAMDGWNEINDAATEKIVQKFNVDVKKNMEKLLWS